MNARGFAFTGALVALAVVAGLCFASFVYGGKVEAEGWIQVLAAQDAEIDAFRRESKRLQDEAAESGKRHVAELEKVRKQGVIEREKWVAEATAGWGAYLDSERLRVDVSPDDASGLHAALTACRVDAARARAGLDSVIAAAGKAKQACDETGKQLKLLQAWENDNRSGE